MLISIRDEDEEERKNPKVLNEANAVQIELSSDFHFKAIKSRR